MKLLITGASGFIGKNLVISALSKGFQVVALLRNQAPSEWLGSKNLTLVFCDLDNEEIPDLSAFDIDCVIHLAASMNLKHIQTDDALLGTKKIISEMQRCGIRKLIGMSSIAVLDYEHVKALATIKEDANVSHDYKRMGKYSILKSKQEDLYKDFGADAQNQCVIIRPGLVYSSEVLSHAHAGIIKSKFQILVSHQGFVPLVRVSSVVEALLQATRVEVNQVEVVHLFDDDLPTQSQYLEILHRRNILKSSGMVLAWWVLSPIVKIIFLIANMFNKVHLLPDSFLPHAFAARMKPFGFSNAKAKQLLNWQVKTCEL